MHAEAHEPIQSTRGQTERRRGERGHLDVDLQRGEEWQQSRDKRLRAAFAVAELLDCLIRVHQD